MHEPWNAPEPGSDAEPLIVIDPRINTTHVVGRLPCPSNPPPPVGWEYWKGKVTAGLGTLASSILKDAEQYPMGAFIQTIVDGELVAARVEWHDLQGATGKKGCFRGVNLMRAQKKHTPELADDHAPGGGSSSLG